MNDSRRSVDDLRARYTASFAHKRDVLTAAWEHFIANPGDPASLRELHTLVHRLAGSAFAYDYDRLGECAREADRLLRNWAESPTETRAKPADFVQRLVEPLRSVLAELERPDTPSTS